MQKGLNNTLKYFNCLLLNFKNKLELHLLISLPVCSMIILCYINVVLGIREHLPL